MSLYPLEVTIYLGHFYILLSLQESCATRTHIYYLIFSGFLILLFHTKNKYLFFNRPMNPTYLTPTDLWTNPDLVASFLDLGESGVI